jgi:hypothetical protein
MEAYMMNEKYIAEMICSHEYLSACGIDGISHQMMTAAGYG